jgi:hypothetical protein
MPVFIVDIIPKQDSFETDQNSEPSIALNPTNPMQMVAGAFGPANAPYYVSSNGGATWSSFGNLQHQDTSSAWKQDGTAVLMTALFDNSGSGNPDMGNLINTYSATVANGNFGFPMNQFAGANLDPALD